jgi:WD40 repeat protein
VWNLDKKELQRTLTYQEKAKPPTWDDALLLARSPNGKLLASTESGFVTQVWDATTADRVVTLKVHTGRVLSLCWAPDNKRLVTSSRDGTARIWDVATGKELFALQKLSTNDETPFVHWSSQDRIAVAHGNAIDVWEAATGKVIKTVACWRVRQAAWSPDGAVLAYVSKEGLLFRDSKTWDLLAQRGTSDSPTPHLAWAPDGSTLAISLTNNEIRYYDGRTFQRRSTFMNFGDGKYLAVSADGHYRASAGVEDRFAYVVQTEKGQETFSPSGFAKRYGWKNDPSKVQLIGQPRASKKDQ